MMERHELVITVFGELPKSCEECIFSSYGQRFCRISNRESPNFRFKDSRCVYCRELPEGHGRLIDADSECEELGSSEEEDVVRYYLQTAPTVIEASE